MKARGFTLLELLLALAIFALMAVMAYGGLRSVLDTREQVDASLERTHALQATIFRIESDIEQSVPRPIRDQFGDSQPALVGSADSGLRLTRNGWRNPLQEARSHLQRVAYRLDADNQLVRWHWQVIDRAQDSAPVKTVLLKQVEQIEWRFLDATGKWQDRWPPQQQGGPPGPDRNASDKLPRMVELRLDTERYGLVRQLFVIPGAQPVPSQ